MPASAESLAYLIRSIREVIEHTDGWSVASRSARFVQAVPTSLAAKLPPIGQPTGRAPNAWLTLEFWIQSPRGGLGVFWCANAVTDFRKRNALLESLVRDPKTGFRSQNTRGDWKTALEPFFSGRTVSARWWPKGGEPSIDAAKEEVGRQLAEWSRRVPAIVDAIVRAELGGAHEPTSPEPAQEAPTTRPPPVMMGSPTAPWRAAGSSTPPIPERFRQFRAQLHYTSIFEIYPDETHLYATEDLYGDWNGEVLAMAKDAGSSRIFQPREQGGFGWAWVHNPARPTNRNLVPLIEQLRCGTLYASFLGPLLRNDFQESGDLFIDDRIRAFVKDLFLWTVANMPSLRTVAVLGEAAWRELALAVGDRAESRGWKSRHVSGQPLTVALDGRSIELVALNHPARIAAPTLMLQPGWQWILGRHGQQ